MAHGPPSGVTGSRAGLAGVHSAGMQTSVALILTGVMVAANAFFVASEFAIVKIRPTRVRNWSSKGGAARICCRESRPARRLSVGQPAGHHPGLAGAGLAGRAGLGPLHRTLADPALGSWFGHRSAHPGLRRQLHPDHLPAHHPGRAGAQGAGHAAGRAGGAVDRAVLQRLLHTWPSRSSGPSTPRPTWCCRLLGLPPEHRGRDAALARASCAWCSST